MRTLFIMVAILGLGAGPALAHTGVHSGAGFLSGFDHPFLGLDHVLAMMAVGILAVQQGRPLLWALPSAFLAMMVAGSILGVLATPFPLIEIGIVGSILVLGLVIATGRNLPPFATIGLIAFLAVFHGYAHGSEMPQDLSAMAYGAGFLLATALLHLLGIFLCMGARQAESLIPHAVRASGGFIAAAGAVIALT